MKKLFLNKHLNNTKGMALAVLLMVFAVVTIIATTGLALSISETNMGVSSQKHVESYYIARAAADVISVDILNKLEEKNQAVTDYNNASTDDKDMAYIAYLAELERISNYNLIPENVGDICNVEVAQIDSNPVSVAIKNTSIGTNHRYDIVATNSSAERPATVKVRIGSITQTTSNIILQTKNALYSWGNIVLGTNGEIIDGAAYSGGTIDVGSNTDIDKFVLDKRDIGIVTPPAEGMIDRRVNNLSKYNQMKTGTANISKADSGYYGELSNVKLDWNVDTTGGDVFLVFSKIETGSQSGTIRHISGDNNLYIFIVQDNSVSYPTDNKTGYKTLFSAMNKLSILGKTPSDIDDNGIEKGLRPKTYVIGYNSNMQNWVSTHDGSKTIPFALQPTINTDAQINNGTGNQTQSILEAYFYFPNMGLVIGNNPFIIGSVFAGNINIKNGLEIAYKPFNKPTADFINYASVSDTIVVEQVTTYNIGNINKQWIR